MLHTSVADVCRLNFALTAQRKTEPTCLETDAWYVFKVVQYLPRLIVQVYSWYCSWYCFQCVCLCAIIAKWNFHKGCFECLYLSVRGQSLLTQDIVVKLHKCFAEIKVKDEYDDGFGLIHGCWLLMQLYPYPKMTLHFICVSCHCLSHHWKLFADYIASLFPYLFFCGSLFAAVVST